MAVGFSNTNKPLNPRAQDQSPKGYNRAKLYSGKALDFDGVNDTITGSSSSLPASGYTIAAWFNLDTLKASGVFTWGDEATSERRSLFVWDGGSGSYYLYSSTYGSNVRGNTPLSVGRWYFGAVTLTTEGEATIYLNGNQDGVGTNTLAAYTGTTYKIGDTGSSETFDGEISGARVFNQVLTAAQVADLYNNPEKVVPTGVDNTALKLWLPMMEGAGTTAYDGSGNGNHGTIAGATYVNGIGAPVAQSAVMDWNKGSNLVAYSEEFNQWTQNISSVTANDTTAPDGQTTADKWVPDSGTTSANLRFNSADIATGTDYVFFCFAKAAGFDVIELDFQNSKFSDATASFNLTSGTITATGGDNVTEGIIDKGDGWYLCYIVGNSITSGSNSCILRQNNSTGDGSKGYYLWGAGFNQASDIVPYVKTSNVIQGSAVLLPQGLTTGRDITGVNLFENVRKQGALNLDGNSWAEVHDNASLDVTDAVTLEAWVYWDGADNKGILGRWHSDSSNRNYLLYKNSVATVNFYINSSAIASYASLNATKGWTHIVGTYNRTNAVLYIDGVQQAITAHTTAISTGTLPVEIGRNFTTSSQALTAPIAQPRIYNRALTASEVLQNYNSGKNTYK